MDENTELLAVGFFEERPEARVRERLTPDVTQHDDAVQFQHVDGALELGERRVGDVHRD